MKVRWGGLALASLCVAPSAQATVNLTGVSQRVGDHPGFVRVVVTFTDGDLRPFEASTLDPSPADGAALLEVAHQGVRAEATPVAALGVRAALTQGRDRVRLRLTTAPGRFKYVSYRALARPERLVVDLWKSAPPSAAATVRSDGCLRLLRFQVAPGRLTVSGLELRPLFEHNVVVRLRDATGRQILVRPLTAAGGRWAGSFRYRVAAGGSGTLEAVSQSARDGSLECLVQMPVTLSPA
jgi:immunoglobulin-like protein involved in spore germination